MKYKSPCLFEELQYMSHISEAWDGIGFEGGVVFYKFWH